MTRDAVRPSLSSSAARFKNALMLRRDFGIGIVLDRLGQLGRRCDTMQEWVQVHTHTTACEYKQGRQPFVHNASPPPLHTIYTYIEVEKSEKASLNSAAKGCLVWIAAKQRYKEFGSNRTNANRSKL